MCLDGKAREMELARPFGNEKIFYTVEFWFCFDLNVIMTWLSPLGIEGRQLVFLFCKSSQFRYFKFLKTLEI